MKNLNTLYVMLIAALPCLAEAAELTINIENIKSNEGTIGCGLYATVDGFPMQEEKALQSVRLKASSSGVVVKFKDLKPGSYAVAVSHDLNGNGKTDTNFLGIPKEDWGVSNNVRPKFRAPTFDEAKFEVDEDIDIRIKID